MTVFLKSWTGTVRQEGCFKKWEGDSAGKFFTDVRRGPAGPDSSLFALRVE